jgi:alkaline phosphatase
MKKLLTTALILGAGTAAMAQAQPRNVIMYIGDGFGVSAKTAARMALGQGTIGKRLTSDAAFQVLALDKLKSVGAATTHSANSWITDSGPGASAYACGAKGKLDNESISFDVATGTPVQTILEKAKAAGYAVGIVTSTRVTHATPATFASHIWFRDLEDYIASQYISSTSLQYQEIYNDVNSKTRPYNAARDWDLPAPKVGIEVDVILGGGARHFLPRLYNDTIKDKNNTPILNGTAVVTQRGSRIDSVNLVTYAKQRGYQYVNSRDALMNIDSTLFTPGNNRKLLGLFNASHVNYEQDRQMGAAWEPSLFEMTEIAIKVLRAKGGTKGFFLLVEGGRIDHLEHANSGGITVVAGTPNQYTVDADKRSYVGGGEAIYSVTPTTARHPNVYGSDYLIKEVLAYDYSVAQGRKLLSDANSKTLIFASSDHECGGTAIVGLHDQANAQNNGTYIRTYALGPRQNGNSASSGGGPTTTTFATPTNVTRGDINFGTSDPNGWYPNYTTGTFQGRPELWPSVDTAGRRIVVSYASNPLTNGNGTNAGGTPGNHTPMDVTVTGEDNMGNTYASQITGIGLFDNTFLTHIMDNFLGLTPAGYVQNPGSVTGNDVNVFPNPTSGDASVKVTLVRDANVQISVTNISGQLVTSLAKEVKAAGTHTWNLNTANLPAGAYLVNVMIDGAQTGKKLVVTH